MPSDRLNAMLENQHSELETKLPSKGWARPNSTLSEYQEGIDEAVGIPSTNSPCLTGSSSPLGRKGGAGRSTAQQRNVPFEYSAAGARLRAYERAATENLKKKKATTGDDDGAFGNVGEEGEGGEKAPHGSNGRAIIERCFVSIGGVKSFTSFQRLTPAQYECIDVLREHEKAIASSRSRDLHLNELIVCITGNDSEEEDEPVSAAAFSQFRFYRTYIHDLVYYPDKFDFLLKCIENSVVKVQQPARFNRLIERIATRDQVRRLPECVVDYERLLEEDEERRLESFTLRKDWNCQVPHYLAGVGDDEEARPRAIGEGPL